MARIPDAELARLKAEVSVQRLVEGCGVQLRKQGSDLVGACPFHDDSSPSLVVTPGKNLWHCLGACGRGGGPIDWVMTAQGVSFRHAVELLREASPALSVLSKTRPWKGTGPAAKSTRPKLPSLVEVDAADQELLNTVVGYYAETLATHDEAHGFLARRGIDHPEVVERFRLGFGDRTLGYRIPGNQTAEGKRIRSRLQALGVLRATGHEHFRGSLVVPVIDEAGDVGEVYGRKIRDDLRAGTATHLYLPGQHRGVFNIAAFADAGSGGELIVCESLIDALTLWCAGFRHVTATYGTDGWTGDHQAAVEKHGIGRVLIAFDADEAGDSGATALAERLAETGVEAFRVQLPRGTDVNEVAVQAADSSEVLGRFLRKATWLDTERPVPSQPPAAVVPPGLDSPAHAAEPVELESVVEPIVVRAAPPAAAEQDVEDEPVDEQGAVVGRELVIELGTRRWRVRGLEKVTSFDVLRVNLLVTRTDRPGSSRGSDAAPGFHVDTLDLYSARARAAFVAAAAGELRFEGEVIKADLGRVLLACEAKVEEVIAAAQAPAKPEIKLTSVQREAALDLLRDPDLIARIEQDFGRVGMVGEQVNCLVGYLTAVSRLLPTPLAVIVQSTSAAGKSAVMESVLGFE